jgi:hypothetical protein
MVTTWESGTRLRLLRPVRGTSAQDKRKRMRIRPAIPLHEKILRGVGNRFLLFQEMFVSMP